MQQKIDGLTFLTDEFGDRPNTAQANTFRNHDFVACYRNGAILTIWMYWATLTRDPSGYYWLVLEAGQQYLPGQGEPDLLWSFGKHGGRPDNDSLEAAILASQPILDQRSITWATRRVTKLQACKWLETKAAYLSSFGSSPYVKQDVFVSRAALRQLLVGTDREFPTLNIFASRVYVR